jgi:hypothetical protein
MRSRLKADEGKLLVLLVMFEYNEMTKKWDPIVSHLEAKQAFSEVVFTCQELLGRAQTEAIDSFNVKIIPIVRS